MVTYGARKDGNKRKPAENWNIVTYNRSFCVIFFYSSMPCCTARPEKIN